MGRIQKYDGAHWDTAKIRRAREFGWIRQNEARLIEEARRRASASERADRKRLVETLLSLEEKCPRCGAAMRKESTEGVDAQRCPVCHGVFFGPGQFEELLVHHDAQRRGLVRRLLREHGHSPL